MMTREEEDEFGNDGSQRDADAFIFLCHIQRIEEKINIDSFPKQMRDKDIAPLRKN